MARRRSTWVPAVVLAVVATAGLAGCQVGTQPDDPPTEDTASQGSDASTAQRPAEDADASETDEILGLSRDSCAQFLGSEYRLQLQMILDWYAANGRAPAGLTMDEAVTVQSDGVYLSMEVASWHPVINFECERQPNGDLSDFTPDSLLP